MSIYNFKVRIFSESGPPVHNGVPSFLCVPFILMPHRGRHEKKVKAVEPVFGIVDIKSSIV